MVLGDQGGVALEGTGTETDTLTAERKRVVLGLVGPRLLILLLLILGWLLVLLLLHILHRRRLLLDLYLRLRLPSVLLILRALCGFSLYLSSLLLLNLRLRLRHRWWWSLSYHQILLELSDWFVSLQ